MLLEKRIVDRFIISDPEQDLLGRGGMGEVYRATDTLTGETVAVKALNPAIVARSPELLERFRREGEALQQLNHPNIVRSLAAVEDSGCHYLVMEYVPGGSLADLLAKEGCLPAERAVEISLDLADALTRAHRLGILHRDLKPANVLLAADGTPRLADFGIAHLSSGTNLTQTGVLVGTVDYLSPEACQGEPVDERLDIWSFGVLLFEMLTGQAPFGGESLTAKLTAILTRPVPDIAILAPNIHDSLADLVYRMLEKDPQKRIPSVRQVGLELEAILKGREPAAAQGHSMRESRFQTPAPSIERLKHNLPTQITPFIGRQEELCELARLLDDPALHLITIVGLGGMGKTRLALQAGQDQVDRFEHGVYFVNLAPLQSVDRMVSTIAGAIRFPFQEKGDPAQQLFEYLQDKRMLLILDNFEHLLEGAGLVLEILTAAPGVKVLVTSRQRLNTQGEQLFNLSGMDFPDWETPADAVEYSAVKLFLQSARRARPGFDLKQEDLKYVARICRLAGGMPLGILMASAWVTILTPQEIAAEMQEDLDFLETGQGDVPERQRSLRAVFDYSWGLLTDQERLVFMGLSVFRGGFIREAAQKVTGAALRDLMGFVSKSLLNRAATGRYEMHELLRQYAAQKLQSEQEGDFRQRHLEYYLSLSETAQLKFDGRELQFRRTSLGDEIDNFRTALDWSLESGRAQTGLKLAICLAPFWHYSRILQEGKGWLQRLLASAPDRTIDRFRGLEGLAYLTHNLGEYNLSESVAEEALALAEALGDSKAIADAAFVLSWPALSLGDADRSRSLMERSLALFRELGATREVAFAVAMLGEVERTDGNMARARELDEQAVELHRSLDSGLRLATAIGNLGCVLIHFGELERARSLLMESLAIELEVGGEIEFFLQSLANLAAANSQPVRAARLLGADEALRKVTGRAVDPGDRADYDRTLASVRARLGEAAFAAAWAGGQAMTEEQAIELALSDESQEEKFNDSH